MGSGKAVKPSWRPGRRMIGPITSRSPDARTGRFPDGAQCDLTLTLVHLTLTLAFTP
jgi:hypothetical protein